MSDDDAKRQAAVEFGVSHAFCPICGRFPTIGTAGRLESHTYPALDGQRRTGECRGTGMKVRDGSQLEIGGTVVEARRL